MKDEIIKGDKVLIHQEDGSTIVSKCTGVTHGNLIHFMHWTEEGNPIAGMIGRDFVKKD